MIRPKQSESSALNAFASIALIVAIASITCFGIVSTQEASFERGAISATRGKTICVLDLLDDETTRWKCRTAEQIINMHIEEHGAGNGQ